MKEASSGPKPPPLASGSKFMQPLHRNSRQRALPCPKLVKNIRSLRTEFYPSLQRRVAAVSDGTLDTAFFKAHF